MRFASIDIGSNGVRLLFEEVYENDDTPVFKKLSLVRLPIRLGEDVFLYKRISEKNVSNLIKMAQAFKHLKDVYGVDDYYACATSAMRDSENGMQVIHRILLKTGINIEVIDGSREADILFDSIFATGRLNPKSSYMFVDVGGGSTEINFYRKGERKAAKSFNVGTIRMKDGIQSQKSWNKLMDWIAEKSKLYEPEYAVGTGGNINKLYKLSGLKNWEILNTKTIKEKITWLEGFTLEEMKIDLELKPYRADVIVPASKIYYSCMKASNLSEMIVPKVGLADGIIQKMYSERVKSRKGKA